MQLWQRLTSKVVSLKLCYVCTRRLDAQKDREPISTENEIVTCKCEKVYVYDRLHRRYSPYKESRMGKIYV